MLLGGTLWRYLLDPTGGEKLRTRNSRRHHCCSGGSGCGDSSAVPDSKAHFAIPPRCAALWAKLFTLVHVVRAWADPIPKARPADRRSRQLTGSLLPPGLILQLRRDFFKFPELLKEFPRSRFALRHLATDAVLSVSRNFLAMYGSSLHDKLRTVYGSTLHDKTSHSVRHDTPRNPGWSHA